MLFDRYVAFSTYIEKLYKDIQKVKTDRMNRFGLRSTDVSVMIMASRHPDGLTVTELASECGVDKAVVSRAMHSLLLQGYMTYTINILRNYRKKIKLTEKGMATVDTISHLAEQAVSEVSRDISQSDLDIFYRTLEKITKNLNSLTGARKTGEEPT
jgi:DNA-binding MarR family transcriptional regulator